MRRRTEHFSRESAKGLRYGPSKREAAWPDPIFAWFAATSSAHLVPAFRPNSNPGQPPFFMISLITEFRLDDVAVRRPDRLATRHFVAAALLWLGLCAPVAVAEISLPNVFSDHMVLQRRQPNRVWGKASPGEKVVVTIGAQSHEATAGADGAWQVTLEPMEAGAPVRLVAKGPANEVAVADVLVGEVWVVSGQSNMASGLSQVDGGAAEAQKADHPQIRLLTIPSRGSQTPVWTQPNARWVVCSPQTAGRFSAVGYIFAQQIHEAVGVPVGIICNAWAGSRAEAWVDRKYFDGHENLLPMVARYDGFAKELAELEAKGQLAGADANRARTLRTDVNGDDRPANAWNGIVASHASYGIRGVLWYQGEGNTPRGHQYRELFPVLVESWRKEWGQGDFPFYWVNLPGNVNEKPGWPDSEWAELREAQTMTLAKVKNGGQAVAIDLGGDGNLHPRNKKDVGLRLASIALARDYGMQRPYQSPAYRAMKADGSKITLSFDSPNGALRTLNGDPIRGFAIAGEDRKFVWADATINRDGTITVSSDQVPNPVAVRYGWADNPVLNVYDNARLPLTPFRTDDWPGITAGVLVH
jgi:sialate O-acetylesterase